MSGEDRLVKCNYCKSEDAGFILWTRKGETVIAVQCDNCQMQTPWVKVHREAIRQWQVIQIALLNGGFSADNQWEH